MLMISCIVVDTYSVDNIQLVDWDLSVWVVPTTEDVVDKARTVQAGLDNDEESSKDDHTSNDCAPPGGIVAKLIKDAAHFTNPCILHILFCLENSSLENRCYPYVYS